MDSEGRRALPWLRALGGALVIALVVWWVGTGPFLAGFRVVGVPSAVAALSIGLVTTVCSAWRWRRIAARLGVSVSWRVAVAAYYRSQFLNATLPTGVVGDLHRAMRHGREIGDVGLAARAVLLDRASSLVTQVALGGVVLLLLPSPVPSPPAAVGLAAALAITAGIAVGAWRWRSSTGVVGVVAVSSGIALAGHLTVFLIAARSAGAVAPLASLVAPMLLALLAMALPVSLAGWGPREGVAAWAFAAAGLGAAQGVTTSVAYGLLSFIGCLPGAAVLVLRTPPRLPDNVAVAAVGQGGAHE